jgi:hypothetical protein
MSDSYRTRPRGIIARERMPRDRNGRVIYPRIIIRKPRPGDIHPLNRKLITFAYKKLPLEYFYGLKEIELRARTDAVSKPFAKYSIYAKKIIMYSVPKEQWYIEDAPRPLIAALRRYSAKVRKFEDGIIVEWEEDFLLFMFYLSIFFHELGHHYLFQYKCKKRPPMDVYLNEWHADAQVVKLQKLAFGRRID